MHDMRPLLKDTDFPALRRRSIKTLQVNLGYLCNQSCLHCHVNAGPNRTESMSKETVEDVINALDTLNAETLDLTGGAPELNPNFRYLVKRARELGVHVIDRCNLTVLSEPEQVNLAAFLAEQEVEVVASLPCYIEDNVDDQRGSGVYQSSIAGLKKLNALGYGSKLPLNLVYNPTGAYLPPEQPSLESDYREMLGKLGIQFTSLFTITNMPIARFGSTLVSKGTFHEYMKLLKESHQLTNLSSVMCKDLVSVDYLGNLFDCDFNQMLSMPLSHNGNTKHLRDLTSDEFNNNPIQIADHCYGCTAGSGSSCGGALS